MTLEEFLAHVGARAPIVGGSPEAAFQSAFAIETQRLTAELNTGFHEPQEVRALMERITRRPVPESFRLFPPFTADFGANIHLGQDVRGSAKLFLWCCDQACCF
ncbi:hypothetical protein [Actinomyces oricola]|uniref:hypothetical protein n=1 Tax=Actinomyces oricola TaxID=206043 RepID=UPI0019D49F99|nr:hypothetical protein [Actinomyces oricola]